MVLLGHLSWLVATNIHLRVIDVGLADGPACDKEYDWSQTTVRSSEESRVVRDGTKKLLHWMCHVGYRSLQMHLDG